MPTYYLTFASKTPFRNGWVEIEAENFKSAFAKAEESLGKYYSTHSIWSNLYEESNFNKSLFPLGKIGDTIK